MSADTNNYLNWETTIYHSLSLVIKQHCIYVITDLKHTVNYCECTTNYGFKGQLHTPECSLKSTATSKYYGTNQKYEFIFLFYLFNMIFKVQYILLSSGQ